MRDVIQLLLAEALPPTERNINACVREGCRSKPCIALSRFNNRHNITLGRAGRVSRIVIH